MRFIGTVFALFSLGLLSGCNAGAPPVNAAETATQPRAQHSVNRYELHGSPDKVALLVDSETGTVWRYREEKGKEEFVPVSLEGKQSQTVTEPIELVWDSTGHLAKKSDVHTPPGFEYDRTGKLVKIEAKQGMEPTENPEELVWGPGGHLMKKPSATSSQKP